MLTVTLPIRDDTLRMPRVCIVCGSSSCRMKKTTFQARFSHLWSFGGSGTRFLYCTVPLCREHETHFDGQFTRGIALVGTIFGVIALSALLAVFLHPVAIVGGLVLGLIASGIFFVTDMAAKQTLVHATRITSDSVTLKNVHRKFVAAVEGEEDEDDRPRRGRDAEDEDWGFRKRDKNAEGRTMVIVWLIVAGIFVFMFCGVGTIVSIFIYNLRNAMPQPQPQSQPPPEGGYLSDMKEFDAAVGWGTFGKNGLLGFEYKGVPPHAHRLLFDGKPYAKGLSMHPPLGGSARVKYRLGRAFRTFVGAAAMADLPANAGVPHAPVPVTFAILGDGKTLWTSRPLQKRGDKQDVRLDVSGVNELELRATVAGSNSHTWAVWLDPAVSR
jgi:hypothetical protein